MNKLTIPALLLGALLAGCASSTDAPAGFVTNSFRDAAELSYKKAPALQGYDTVYIQSVSSSQSGGMPLPESDIAALEFAFEDAFNAAMGKSFTIATGPGPKTLAVNASIGEVMHKNTLVNPMANNPADAVNTYGDDAAIPALSNAPVEGSNLCVCSVHLNVKFSDSLSAELLAQFSDHGFGADVEIAETGETSWSRVSAAMHHWCQEMADELSTLTK